jgi:hypothetical protein
MGKKRRRKEDNKQCFDRVLSEVEREDFERNENDVAVH